MATLSLESEQSLWKRIHGKYRVTTDGCWIYDGPGFSNGYPSIGAKIDGKWKKVGVYRAMYMLFFDIPKPGLHLDHLCRKPACINPTHLEPVTCKENLRRSPLTLGSINSAKTHCLRGHEFSEANTYIPPKRPNRRYCKECLAYRCNKRRGKL